jgi:hypothetical protein
MSQKVHMKHRVKVKRGQQYRHSDTTPDRFHCVNCQRALKTRYTLCRKLRNCPGRVRDRLLKACR